MKNLTKKTINEGIGVTKNPFNASYFEVGIIHDGITIRGTCSNYSALIEIQTNEIEYYEDGYNFKKYLLNGCYSKRDFIDFIQVKYNGFVE